MSSTQLNGASSSRRKPRPKGGHQPIQAEMPATLGYELVKVADETSVQKTDLGGYLMI